MPKSELDSWGLHNWDDDPQAQRMMKKEARRREIYKLKKEGKYTPRTRGAKSKAASRPEHFAAGSTEHELAVRMPTNAEIKRLGN